MKSFRVSNVVIAVQEIFRTFSCDKTRMAAFRRTIGYYFLEVFIP